MNARRHNFSLLEVIVVMVILAFIMSMAVGSIDKSPGTITLELKDELKRLFGNAATRAQAFNREVILAFKPDEEGYFTCSIKGADAQASLIVNIEDESEEELLERSEREGSVRVWSGEDEYDNFSQDISLVEYEDFLNEEEQILFYFYPDGEATGPEIKLKILEQEYSISVGRLNSQLQWREAEY